MSTLLNSSSEDAEYVLNLPHHLDAAGMTDDMNKLLTEFEFMEHKISVATPQRLIDDYNLALQPDHSASKETQRGLHKI